MIKAKKPEGPWSEPLLIKAGKGIIDPAPLWMMMVKPIWDMLMPEAVQELKVYWLYAVCRPMPQRRMTMK